MPRNPYYDGPPSANFDGVRFFSPGQPSPDRKLGDVLRWQVAGKRARWPRSVPVTRAAPPERSEAPRLTMVGHCSVLIQVAGVNILTDPVWSERASPVAFAGPRRVTEPGIALASLPPIDAVLVSHNHYDHLDIATLRRLHRHGAPQIVVPLGNDTILRRAVPKARVVAADWHEEVPLADGVRVTLTPANHWSSRGLLDRRMALWSGFWIAAPQGAIWFAGDTGYGDGAIFREIRARHGRPDIALIPIGSYEPRWFMAPQHVAPEESVRIFKDLEPRQALGIHWGTFQLTDEAREEPVEQLGEALAAEGIRPEAFRAFGPGDVHQGVPPG